MREDDDVFCSRAVAYLKVETHGSDPALKLAPLDEPILRPFGNGLLATYIVDGGEVLNLVQRRHLLGAGITEDELHERAVTNLLDLARERLEVRSYKGVFAVLMDGTFEASLLLIDSLWDEDLSHLAPRGFVAAAPARDVLAFCDAASPAGVRELRAVIARADTGVMNHPLTPALLRRQGKFWVRHTGSA